MYMYIYIYIYIYICTHIYTFDYIQQIYGKLPHLRENRTPSRQRLALVRPLGQATLRPILISAGLATIDARCHLDDARRNRKPIRVECSTAWHGTAWHGLVRAQPCHGCESGLLGERGLPREARGGVFPWFPSARDQPPTGSKVRS